MDEYLLFQQLGISLLLGLLVGLQRERTTRGRPGLRTFPLISVFGTVSALLATTFGGWVILGGMLAVVTIVTLPRLFYYLNHREEQIGTTTEMAALLMFGVGAMLPVMPLPVVVAVGGGIAILLQFKFEMHQFAEKLGNNDLKAIMQFVLISFIILPVLPNKTFGPFDVFNPFETWLMVALIVGMSLGGYIIYKFFGRDAGILLGGIIGGAISSTATTVSYARRARDSQTQSRIASIVVMIASTVVFGRVLIEIAVVSPAMLRIAAPPIIVFMSLVMLPSLVLWYRVRKEPNQMPEQENPTQLKSAIMFGAMYAAVLLALAATKFYLGGVGLYVVAALSGLTDMDAITLSTARMAIKDPVMMQEGWRLIIVGAMANLVFKAMLAGALGGRRFMFKIIALFTIPFVGGVLLLLFWKTL